MSDMHETVSAVVVGPEDRLVLLADLDALLPHDDMQALVDRLGLTGRVLLVDRRGVQAVVLRATKAEGSTVGQCGDRVRHGCDRAGAAASR